MYASYNLVTNKLKFFPEGERLSEEENKKREDLGLSWWPGQKCFAGAWSPHRVDWIESFGITIFEDDSADDIESRIERYQRHAETAEKNTKYAEERLKNANTDRRFEHALSAIAREEETAIYWQDRIAGAIALAQYKDKPDVIARRIKGLEAEKRKFQREQAEAQKCIKAWTEKELTLARAIAITNYFDHTSIKDSNGRFTSAWGLLVDGKMDAEQVRDLVLPAHERTIKYTQRWLDHLDIRIQYETSYFQAVGGRAEVLNPPRRKSVAPSDGLAKGQRVFVGYGVKYVPGTILTLSAKTARIKLEDETAAARYPKGYQVGRRFIKTETQYKDLVR